MDFNNAHSLSHGQDAAPMAARPAHSHVLIGEVIEIAGSSSQLLLDGNALQSLKGHGDPSIAMAGQVGSQVKIRIGDNWLVAAIRTQKMHQREAGLIIATIDFLGEGDEEVVTGRINNFRHASS